MSGLYTNKLQASTSSDINSKKRKRNVERNSDMKPVRQYFHSKNLIPMQPNAWDRDSDDESNTTWMQTISDEVMFICNFVIFSIILG